jgi:hypothetical protein
MLLNAKVASVMQPVDTSELSSEFYQNLSPNDVVEPNLTNLDSVYPYTGETFASSAPTPNIADIVASTFNQFVNSTPTPTIVAPTNGSTISTAVGQVANAVGNAGGTILGNLLNQVVAGVGNGVQDSAGSAGASIVDSTLKVWFKKNWYYVAGGVILLFGGIWYFAKHGKKTAISKYRR